MPGKPKAQTAPTSPVPEKVPDTPLQICFSAAVEWISAGKRVTRLAWDNPNEYIFLGETALMIHGEHRTAAGVVDGPVGNHILMLSRVDWEACDWYVIPD